MIRNQMVTHNRPEMVTVQGSSCATTPTRIKDTGISDGYTVSEMIRTQMGSTPDHKTVAVAWDGLYDTTT
jgi:hypothetical protein